MKLDRTDTRIIAELQNNARLSNKELASRVGLAPSSCLERMRRLQEEGVFEGFHAMISPAVLGVGIEAMVSVRMKQHSKNSMESLRSFVLGFDEVMAVYHVAGAIDFLVHVAVRDTAHLRDLVLEAFSIRDEVGHVETALIFKCSRKWALPNYA